MDQELTEKVFEFDGLSSQTIQREMSEEELANLQNFHSEITAIKAKVEQDKANRTAALAKFAALGLTEEEIAAL
jgi:hypothetical protein